MRGVINGLEQARHLPENQLKIYNNLLAAVEAPEKPVDRDVEASPIPGKDDEDE